MIVFSTRKKKAPASKENNTTKSSILASPPTGRFGEPAAPLLIREMDTARIVVAGCPTHWTVLRLARYILYVLRGNRKMRSWIVWVHSFDTDIFSADNGRFFGFDVSPLAMFGIIASGPRIYPRVRNLWLRLPFIDFVFDIEIFYICLSCIRIYTSYNALAFALYYVDFYIKLGGGGAISASRQTFKIGRAAFHGLRSRRCVVHRVFSTEAEFLLTLGCRKCWRYCFFVECRCWCGIEERGGEASGYLYSKHLLVTAIVYPISAASEIKYQVGSGSYFITSYPFTHSVFIMMSTGNSE